MHDDVVAAANGLSLAAIISTLAGWLPPIAALGAIIWYTILIYDRITKGPKQ